MRTIKGMQTRQSTGAYRLLLVTVFCVISYLATTNRKFPILENISDKISHITAFYTLALLVDFSWPRSGFRAPKALPLFGYGLAIEVAQYFLPYRSFSLFDLGADVLGMLLYVMSLPLLRKTYPLSKRFEMPRE